MRVLYKAVASVSMIVLSAAAAFGIRHLRRLRKKRAEANASDVSQAESQDDTEQDHSQDADPVSESEETDQSGDDTEDAPSSDNDALSNDVVEADTPVKSDVMEDQD